MSKLSTQDVDAIKALAHAMDKEALSGNFKALVNLFTEDAFLMGPNSPAMKGRKELLEFIESSGLSISEHKMNFLEIEGYGDLAYANGAYTESFKTTDTDTIRVEGKILGVFRKQADESWLIDQWSWNSNLP